MASVLKGSSPDNNPWWTEYVHISKTGIPICHPKKPGHCRAIQQKHKSSKYCLYKPGRYVLCDQPGQGEVAEKLWYPPTPDAVKTLSRKERSPRDRIFIEGDEWSGSRRSKCKQPTQGDPSRWADYYRMRAKYQIKRAQNYTSKESSLVLVMMGWRSWYCCSGWEVCPLL